MQFKTQNRFKGHYADKSRKDQIDPDDLEKISSPKLNHV